MHFVSFSQFSTTSRSSSTTFQICYCNLSLYVFKVLLVYYNISFNIDNKKALIHYIHSKIKASHLQLLQLMGLEPTPSNLDMNLNHARMPIPPQLQIIKTTKSFQHYNIIVNFTRKVKGKIKFTSILKNKTINQHRRNRRNSNSKKSTSHISHNQRNNCAKNSRSNILCRIEYIRYR